MLEVQTINLVGVNAYLVKTETGFILFDCGFANNRSGLQKALDEAGVTPANLKLLVLTHGDIDHTGNGAYLKRKYGVKIAIHRLDNDMVEKGALNEDRQVKSILMRFVHGLFKENFKKMMAAFEPFSPDMFLEEGSNLKEYGLEALVYHTPGHTGGSISIHLENGDLIVGDLLQNRGRKPGLSAIVSSEPQLEASIKRLNQLKINRVYPGHGKPFRMSEKIRV